MKQNFDKIGEKVNSGVKGRNLNFFSLKNKATCNPLGDP